MTSNSTERVWVPIVWFKTEIHLDRIPDTYFVVGMTVGRFETTLRMFSDSAEGEERDADRRLLMTAAEVLDEDNLHLDDTRERLRVGDSRLWLVTCCTMPLHVWLPPRLMPLFTERLEEALVRQHVLRLDVARET